MTFLICYLKTLQVVCILLKMQTHLRGQNIKTDTNKQWLSGQVSGSTVIGWDLGPSIYGGIN